MQNEVADVRQAIQYVAANAHRFGVARGRVGGLGASAGGHLLTLANAQLREGVALPAIVNWSGPLSTAYIQQQNPNPTRFARTIRAAFTNAIGCERPRCQRRWESLDPIYALRSSLTRFSILTLVGETETQVPPQEAVNASTRLRTLGHRSIVVVGRGACHGDLCGRMPIGNGGRTGMDDTRVFFKNEL